MGYVEIIKTTKTSIRIENGVLTKGGVRHCDGCGVDRSDIRGVETVINEDLTLWICKECDSLVEVKK